MNETNITAAAETFTFNNFTISKDILIVCLAIIVFVLAFIIWISLDRGAISKIIVLSIIFIVGYFLLTKDAIGTVKTTWQSVTNATSRVKLW